MEQFRNIGIIGRLGSSQVLDTIRRLKRFLVERHLHVILEENIAEVLPGDKAEKKVYFRHTGYIGGAKFTPFKEMLEKHPERVIELAVKGMMPKNNLGRLMRKKLRVYAGPEHPHEGQQPELLEI